MSICGKSCFSVVEQVFRHFSTSTTKMSSAAKIPAVTKLSAKVTRILGMNPGPMTLQGTNTYLVGSGRRRLLLDAGDPGHSDYVANLDQVLAAENAQIATILVTHWHHDHIGGVRDVLELERAKGAAVWKFPRTDEADEDQCGNFEMNLLTDEQVFHVDEATNLKVYHTPGHTTDHAVVVDTDNGCLFSGDCILGEGTAVFEDLFDYMRSLDRILALSPKQILPGHGNIIDDPVPKIKYYISHRNQREAQIVEVLQASPARTFTALEIVEQIYKDTPKELYPAAAYNVSHHLTKLRRENVVIETGEADEPESRWQAKKQSML